MEKLQPIKLDRMLPLEPLGLMTLKTKLLRPMLEQTRPHNKPLQWMAIIK